MLIAIWIALGLIEGVVANQLRGRRGVGLAFDVLYGVAGACFAGFVFKRVSGSPDAGVSLWTVIVSVAGAALALRVAAVHGAPRGANSVAKGSTKRKMVRR